jgi:alpha-galactosidase
MLRKLQPPPGVAARFEDDSFRIGRTQLGKREVVSVLNATNSLQNVSIRLARRVRIRDFWTDAELGTHVDTFVVKDMPGHSGRLFICE